METGVQTKHALSLIDDASTLSNIPDDKLIRTFKIKSKGKARTVNDPVPALKSILKDWNKVVTDYYVDQLAEHGLSHIAHAYLPGRSIQTNAAAHINSDIIQFDFKGFYDSCRFEYFSHHLKALDHRMTDDKTCEIKRLLINPDTGGITQGLPVSGALAGLSLIPFWKELKRRLPENIRFTQYSDDLTFSHAAQRTPEIFNVKDLKAIIYESLGAAQLEFTLNADKTRRQSAQYRKVTGIRINHLNQTTPSKKDHRFLKHALYILSKSNNLEEELDRWGFESKEAFVGKISYMRSIDSTGKIDRTIMKYRNTCRKHNLFITWIDANDAVSPFA